MPNGTQYGQIQTGYAGTWVDDVLRAIGAPTTDSNRAALRAWAASEGTASSNNPLAFSGKYPGATTCLAQCGSGSPVYAYSSAAQGAQNTADFLLHNAGYAGVVSSFRQDAGLSAIFKAVNSSGWCKGCQGGNYPNALAKVAGVSGGTAFPSSAASAPAGVNVSTPLGSFQLLDPAQTDKFKGWFLMIAGGFVGVVGLVVIMGSLGLESKLGRTVAGVPGVGYASGRLAQRGRDRAAAQRQEDRLEVTEAKGREQRYSGLMEGQSRQGARPATAEHRRQSRARLERARASQTPEERRANASF